MKIGVFFALITLAWSTQAQAERLSFDHRLYPPLKVVLDSGNAEMTEFDNSNPRYIFDRIAIQGKSASDWTEALEIIARSPAKEMRTAQDWLREIQQKSAKSCPGTFEILAQDENSITVSRISKNCPSGQRQTALFRIVMGKHSLFLLNPIFKGEMSDAMRNQWLALLQSAYLQ